MKNTFATVLLCAGSLISFAADVRTNAPSAAPSHPAGAVVDKVSEEQRAKLRELNEKFRADQNGLYEKLRNARRDLEQTAQADVADEKAIRAKAGVLGQVEGDLTILRAKHYKELRTILPRDQAARQSGLATMSTNQFAQHPLAGMRTNGPMIAPPPQVLNK